MLVEFARDAARMQKLLFVTKYIDHILYFCLERLSSQMALTVVVDQENQWTRALASSGIALTYLKPRSKFDRRYQASIEALGGNGGWDLVQCFHGNAELANLIQWNRRRLPLVAYRARIGHLKFRENPTAYWNARNPGLAAVAAVSRAVKAYLESFAVLQPNNVRVVHHGIDRGWVDSELRQRYNLRPKLDIPADALIVISMAALRPVKRFEYIVHAAEQLEELPIHFVHIGEPRGWDDKARHLPKVRFLGRQAAPLPILADGDVFAMTSHNEAFGRANLEAMACGKPVIGSDTGGLLDLVEPGVTGQLFATARPDDFALAVRRYCEDRNSVLEHGKNALARVDRLFSSERMARDYLRLYADVLGGDTNP